MGLYDHLADLPLVVEDHDRTRQSRATSSGFERVSTTFALHGAGETGKGEDVTYDAEDHEALTGWRFSFEGEYTLAGFSEFLDGVELFPGHPQREDSRHYRRWAVESAALDLALRQADTSLAAALNRDPAPVRFVVSTRLEGGSTDRLEALLDAYPDVEFKLDPTAEWDEDLIADVAALDRVRILDLKGQYRGTVVDGDPDPDLYERVVDGFPEAVVEDPAVTDETRAVVERVADRVSWDAPITGVQSIRDLPFDPHWLNVKPSRFGTVESLFDSIEYARKRDVTLYGGGQFELDVGRGQIQTLASLCYPDGPNDVAPGGYNDPDVSGGLQTSPLPARTTEGFR
ncbi:hypothetical protein [Halomarina litorea]|uniref:hypothetical protein n=1 Tax=Halomarina litorea TaxID=2961595 RepID=UPI0020C2960B|nr:hypothetical protein [Halomarina sp. BCD28]